jgi:coenzyme F420-reducing hydrogenase delta subunit
MKAHVIEALCKGCGTCVGACPKSINLKHYGRTTRCEMIGLGTMKFFEMAEAGGLMFHKIIGFLCNWCSYRGADAAGMARLKYPPNVKIIRVPCSGRISPELVLRTFREGADGVMVLGCHIGDCHYSTGNHRTAKRMPILKKLLEYTGIEPERAVNWVSSAEGEVSAVIHDFTETIEITPIR